MASLSNLKWYVPVGIKASELYGVHDLAIRTNLQVNGGTTEVRQARHPRLILFLITHV